MFYILHLTSEDVETIGFVGDRYFWSEALADLEEGDNEVSESDAWGISAAFEADTEGGHDMFPMLDRHSDLCERLLEFYDGII